MLDVIAKNLPFLLIDLRLTAEIAALVLAARDTTVWGLGDA